MKHIRLAYGEDSIGIEQVDLEFDQVLALEQPSIEVNKHIGEALDNPYGLKSFDQGLIDKDPESIAILVEDNTRKNPEYPEILDEIITRMTKISAATIYLVIAYGTHKHHSEEDSERLYGKSNISRVRVIHHDSKDKSKLVEVGKDKGVPLLINKWVYEADYLMVIGSVKPHAFAGYTGGRKMILPGVASYENIRNNHSMVGQKNVGMGKLEGNPIHEDMARKAALVKIDFSIQMVKDATGKLAGYYSGDASVAFTQGTLLSKKLCGLQVDEKADVVVACVGGVPKDRSLYQSQRAITNAVAAVKEDGLVFIIGQLSQGVGNELYGKWLSKSLDEILALSEKQIDIGIHSAYLTALNYKRCHKIYLHSQQDKMWTESYHFDYLPSLENIQELIKQRYGSKCLAYLIPNASDIMIIDNKSSGEIL